MYIYTYIHIYIYIYFGQNSSGCCSNSAAFVTVASPVNTYDINRVNPTSISINIYRYRYK